MPGIRCCEHPAVPFQFPANSEKQFLGILKFEIIADARFLLLWISICYLLISLNFRETISGLRELKNQYRCPDFIAVNTPWDLLPCKTSVTEKYYLTGVQIWKMWQGLVLQRKLLNRATPKFGQFFLTRRTALCYEISLNCPFRANLRYCRTNVSCAGNSPGKKTLPRLCGAASLGSCWVLHSTGGMSVKGGVSRRSGPLTDNSVLC